MFKRHSHDWKREIFKRNPCFFIVLGVLFKNPWSKLSLVHYEIQYGAKFGEKYQKIGNFFFHNFISSRKSIGTWFLLWSTVIGIVELQEKICLTDFK